VGGEFLEQGFQGEVAQAAAGVLERLDAIQNQEHALLAKAGHEEVHFGKDPSQAEPGSSGINTDKGRISARNVTLRRCIRGAYNVPETQVLGGPKWIDEERYDIEAKAAGPAGDHEMMIMLQSLLAERFNLVFHRETRPMSGYALVVGKSGLKAQHSAPDAGSRTSSRRGGIDAQACTMAQLAQRLSEAVHLPVADFTAAEGRFDFKLQWTPEDAQARPPSAGDKPGTPADAGPSIFAALQEQLGLKLESRKVPTEVLVIDRAGKASEN
jgi:uncharacterized protein (TIGR03435 family)